MGDVHGEARFGSFHRACASWPMLPFLLQWLVQSLVQSGATEDPVPSSDAPWMPPLSSFVFEYETLACYTQRDGWLFLAITCSMRLPPQQLQMFSIRLHRLSRKGLLWRRCLVRGRVGKGFAKL